MPDITPNDIGLATFLDVGDVQKLKTSAKVVVDAINEIYQTGGERSLVIGEQLLIDGENNIILGENNIVKGSNNLIIGSNNLVNGNGYRLIGGDRIVCKDLKVTGDYIEVAERKIVYGFATQEAAEAGLPISEGDMLYLPLKVIWTNNDWTDNCEYEDVCFTQVEQISESESYIIVTEFNVLLEPPDEVHTILSICYAPKIYALNDSFKQPDADNSNLTMGSSSTGQSTVSVNGAVTEGEYTFAANKGTAIDDCSTAFGIGYAGAKIAFAANKGVTYCEGGASLNYGECFAPYSTVVGNRSKVFGRSFKCVALDTVAKKLTIEKGYNLASIAGKTIHIRAYRQSVASLYIIATVASVSGNVLTLTDVNFTSGTYAEKLFPDSYAFIIDSSTSYGNGNFSGGNYSVAGTRYSFAYGQQVCAAKEGAAIFGKYGVLDEEYALALGNGNSLKETGLAFKVLGDGNVYADGSYSSPCADYAEFFEWADGNLNREDRAGYFVKLEGEKIVKCGEFDNPLGVVSAVPAIIGDCGEFHWKNKFLTDDFGRVIYHDVLVPEEKDEDGNIITEEHTERQPCINPKWNNDEEYIPRKNRPEWSPVGVIGKLIVYDDGSLVSGDFCRTGADGKAVKALENGYPVLKRVSDDKVLIWFRG